MIVWGGASQKTGHLYNDGASYDPGHTDLAAAARIAARARGRARRIAWTGSKLFVWGGRLRSVPIPDGALYDPITRTWQRCRRWTCRCREATAVWTGRDVVLFTTAFRSRSAQVHAYNPADNSWTTLPNITDQPDRSCSRSQALEVGANPVRVDCRCRPYPHGHCRPGTSPSSTARARTRGNRPIAAGRAMGTASGRRPGRAITSCSRPAGR